MTTLNQQKHNKINELLTTGNTITVVVDPKDPEALVPEKFTNDQYLVLDIGLNMYIAIPDLNWDEKGIVCTLSFNKVPFQCFIPWSCLLQVCFKGDSHGWSWVNFITQKYNNTLRAGREPQENKPQPAAPVSAKSKHPHLRLVKC